jgi:hypothetical protein
MAPDDEIHILKEEIDMTTDVIDPNDIDERPTLIEDEDIEPAQDLSINEEELHKMFGGSQTTADMVKG